MDTHAHLNFKAYEADRAEVIQRCLAKPMAVINVGTQFKTSQEAVELTRQHDNFYAAVGLHPIHVFDESFNPGKYQALVNDKVVAVGEAGFDFWHFKHLKEPYKIILLHGWGGSKEERFFIWLEQELTALGHKVIRFDFPNTDNPNQKKWLQKLEQEAGYINGKTLFVGFSLGGVTALRFLEELDEDVKVGGVYLLGTPTADLGYNELKDFFKTDLNWGKLKTACNSYYIYNSTNDEIVSPDHGQKLARELDSEVTVVEGAWHFNVEKLPQLLDDIKQNIKNLNESLPTIEEVIKRQKEVFEAHIDLALKNNLPLILHGRNGLAERNVYLEMLDILKAKGADRAVFHFFGGDLATAKTLVQAGYFIGTDGPLTFDKKSEELQAIIRDIPLDKVLIETDSPYLAPEPFRGQRNEPVYVEQVAKKIADLKNLTLEEIIEQIWQNAKNLFKLKG